jgi:hypothetical protein
MNVTLVIAVIVLSGVVAYVGDIIGKRLGKKRVSLFGLRPRQTAVLVAVTTGWIITAGTIAVLAVASSSVREAVFNLERLHQQVRDAQSEAQLALMQRDGTLAELRDVESQLGKATARASEAQAAADEAAGEVVQTRGELEQASGQVHELQSREGWLERNIHQLTSEGEKARKTRDQALAEAGDVSFSGTLYLYGYGMVRSETYVLQPGDELARVILQRGTTVEDVRRGIARLVSEATDAAKANGCAPYDYPDDNIDATSGLYLILRPAEPQSGAEWRQLSIGERQTAYDQHLRYLADQAASRTQAGESVYITLNVWDYPVPSRRPAIVDFRMDRVEPAFYRGNVLATQPIALGATKNDIAAACHELLRKARATAVDRGTVWRRSGIREIPYEDLESVVQEVLRLQRDQQLAARLSAVVTQEECLNIDEPEIRIEVDPVL